MMFEKNIIVSEVVNNQKIETFYQEFNGVKRYVTIVFNSEGYECGNYYAYTEPEAMEHHRAAVDRISGKTECLVFQWKNNCAAFHMTKLFKKHGIAYMYRYGSLVADLQKNGDYKTVTYEKIDKSDDLFRIVVCR